MVPEPKLVEIIKKLPNKPGVYQFLNQKNEIIYIGKAKNLNKRISSHFSADQTSYKQAMMIQKVKDIKYILVGNESEALLLENNLIKENQPKYNILLKDDKTYPWICIKNEPFPRVYQTRNRIDDGTEYFGPYTSVVMVRTLLELIQQLFKPRTCALDLKDKSIKEHKFRRCLEFQLQNCKAPCEGLQSQDDYNRSILQVRQILQGNFFQVIEYLKVLMKECVFDLKFEEAEIVRRKVEILNNYAGKSTIVSSTINNVDVFSYIENDNNAYINYFKVVNGSIIQAHNLEVVKRINEHPSEILGYVIFDIRKRFKSNSREIIVPILPNIAIPNCTFTIPKKGDKLKLLELSKRNAFSYKTDKELLKETEERSFQENSPLIQLQKDLRLKKLPTWIECFDISNIQGRHQVASCIVFKDGKPLKSSYRHFNIKSVEGQNDFASMEEVIFRRYTRILKEKEKIPDLIIIDGGKGQLAAALKGLKNANLIAEVSVISIAKRLEEIYLPYDPVPLYLDKNSFSLRLVQKMRDEAHRFGITFHRNKRSGAQLRSELEDIPGIGPKTVERLLKAEIDVSVLKEMNMDDLIRLAGKKTATSIFNYYNETIKGL